MTFDDAVQAGTVGPREMSTAFDGLAPVSIEAVLGTWKADASYAETPGGRLLVDSGWWGARFTDAQHADPLLFRTADGTGLFAADLGKVFALISTGPQDLSARRAEVETREPMGRLRMVECRGVVSATLIYDHAPILDYIRAVDGDTLIAAVEGRGAMSEPGYVLLRRHPAKSVGAARSAPLASE